MTKFWGNMGSFFRIYNAEPADESDAERRGGELHIQGGRERVDVHRQKRAGNDIRVRHTRAADEQKDRFNDDHVHIQHGGRQSDGKGSSGRGNDDDDIRVQRQGVADFDECGDGQRDDSDDEHIRRQRQSVEQVESSGERGGGGNDVHIRRMEQHDEERERRKDGRKLIRRSGAAVRQKGQRRCDDDLAVRVRRCGIRDKRDDERADGGERVRQPADQPQRQSEHISWSKYENSCKCYDHYSA